MTEGNVETLGKDQPPEVDPLKNLGEAEAVKKLKADLVDAKIEIDREVRRRKALEVELEKVREVAAVDAKELGRHRELNAALADKLNATTLKWRAAEARPDPAAVLKELDEHKLQVSVCHRKIGELVKKEEVDRQINQELGRKIRGLESHIARVETACRMMQNARDLAERERNAASSRASIAENAAEEWKTKAEDQLAVIAQAGGAIAKLLATVKVCEAQISAPADASIWTMISDAKEAAQP